MRNVFDLEPSTNVSKASSYIISYPYFFLISRVEKFSTKEISFEVPTWSMVGCQPCLISTAVLAHTTEAIKLCDLLARRAGDDCVPSQ